MWQIIFDLKNLRDIDKYDYKKHGALNTFEFGNLAKGQSSYDPNLTSNDGGIGINDRAFLIASVYGTGSGGDKVAHEFGHLLGMWHTRGVYGYENGKKVNKTYPALMDKIASNNNLVLINIESMLGSAGLGKFSSVLFLDNNSPLTYGFGLTEDDMESMSKNWSLRLGNALNASKKSLEMSSVPISFDEVTGEMNYEIDGPRKNAVNSLQTVGSDPAPEGFETGKVVKSTANSSDN